MHYEKVDCIDGLGVAGVLEHIELWLKGHSLLNADVCENDESSYVIHGVERI